MRFKLHAETWHDLVLLAEALMPNGGERPISATSITIKVRGIGRASSVAMEFTSSRTLDELLAIIDGIEGGHVMYETVQPFEQYTGKRQWGRKKAHLRSSAKDRDKKSSPKLK